jgi:MOSC domain-containing protein YiiM
MDGICLLSIQVGRTQPLGPDAVPSAFVKRPVVGPVAVGPLGLAGDEQADLSVHGGPDKAVYAYPAAHHAAWRGDFPEHRAAFVAGGVGENLTVDGLTEADLCVGDLHRIGSATLQLVQPRQPCFKFALRFGDNRLPKAMVRNGRAGWYYRVIEPGTIRAGDSIERIARPYPELGFERLIEIVNFRNPTRDELEAMAAMDGLAHGLRAKARHALGLAP